MRNREFRIFLGGPSPGFPEEKKRNSQRKSRNCNNKKGGMPSKRLSENTAQDIADCTADRYRKVKKRKDTAATRPRNEEASPGEGLASSFAGQPN